MFFLTTRNIISLILVLLVPIIVNSQEIIVSSQERPFTISHLEVFGDEESFLKKDYRGTRLFDQFDKVHDYVNGILVSYQKSKLAYTQIVVFSGNIEVRAESSFASNIRVYYDDELFEDWKCNGVAFERNGIGYIFLDRRRFRTSNYIQQFFIVAHEFAHHLYGHTGLEDAWNTKASMGKPKEAHQEKEADFIAGRLMAHEYSYYKPKKIKTAIRELYEGTRWDSLERSENVYRAFKNEVKMLKKYDLKEKRVRPLRFMK